MLDEIHPNTRILGHWAGLLGEAFLVACFSYAWLWPERQGSDESLSLFLTFMAEMYLLALLVGLDAFEHNLKELLSMGIAAVLLVVIAAAALAGGYYLSGITLLSLGARFVGACFRREFPDEFPGTPLQAMVCFGIFAATVYLYDWAEKHGFLLRSPLDESGIGGLGLMGCTYFGIILAIRIVRIMSGSAGERSAE